MVFININDQFNDDWTALLNILIIIMMIIGHVLDSSLRLTCHCSVLAVNSLIIVSTPSFILVLNPVLNLLKDWV